MNEFKYDIAISLCKEDVGYARDLVKALNPKLRVFFYEDRQEELVTKSAPEAFKKVFKEEARVVVILYRERWGNTLYTGIEEEAILERLKEGKGREGHSFIFIIQFDKGKKPGWYPVKYIYADPYKYPIEKIAGLLEFKLSEIGVEITPMTFEERINWLRERLKKKEKILNYLSSDKSSSAVLEEIEKLKKVFSDKIEFLKRIDIFNRLNAEDINQKNIKVLEGKIFINGMAGIRIRIVAIRRNGQIPSQFYTLQITLLKGNVALNERSKNEVENKEYKFNTDGEYVNGWSEINYISDYYKKAYRHYLLHLDTEAYYLGRILTSEELIELWLKKVYDILEENYRLILK